MLLTLERAVLPGEAPKVLSTPLFLLVSVPSDFQKGGSRRQRPAKNALQTETKTNCTIDSVAQDRQDEVGVSCSKGNYLDVTGSKGKRGASEVTLLRGLVKGRDARMFRITGAYPG